MNEKVCLASFESDPRVKETSEGTRKKQTGSKHREKNDCETRNESQESEGLMLLVFSWFESPQLRFPYFQVSNRSSIGSGARLCSPGSKDFLDP